MATTPPILSAAENNMLVNMFSAIHQYQVQDPLPGHFVTYMTHELQYMLTQNGYSTAEAARLAWVKGHIKKEPLTRKECKTLNQQYKMFRDNYGWRFQNEKPPPPPKKPPKPTELPKKMGNQRIIDY